MNLRPTAEDEVQALAAKTLAEQLRAGELPARTVVLYHTSPSRNTPSILQHGLLLAYAQSRTPSIWLCSRTWVIWAIGHTRRRHTVQAVTIFEVRIPRRKIARYTQGRWFTRENVPVEQIRVWNPLEPKL